MLRNFALDAIFRALSAPPVNITSSRDIGFGSYNLRPDIIPGVPVYIDDPSAPGGRRINRAAFDADTPNAEKRLGTFGRNSVRGFGLSQVDLALRREFTVREGMRLQFRVELFNALNHPNFAPPQTSLTSSLFGQSTQMLASSLGSGGAGGLNPIYQQGGPRSMQLGLKLQF
jgi:hypothetical protein